MRVNRDDPRFATEIQRTEKEWEPTESYSVAWLLSVRMGFEWERFPAPMRDMLVQRALCPRRVNE